MPGKSRSAVEEVLAEASASDASGTKRPKNLQKSKKDVVIQNAEGPVTIVDYSVNVAGDDNDVSNGARHSADASGNLMGDINVAIDEVYRGLNAELTLHDLGCIGYEHHAAISAACQSEEEFSHAIEIMKIRLRKKITEKKETE